MAFDYAGLKISPEEIAEHGVAGMPDVPGLTASEMQKRFDALATYLGEEKYNRLLERMADEDSGVPSANEVRRLIGEAVFESGAGDMSRIVYDRSGRQNDVYDYADAAVAEVGGALDGVISGAVETATGFNSYAHAVEERPEGGLLHKLYGSGGNIKFTAVAAWREGDVLEINGAGAQAKTADGNDLRDGAFSEGAVVDGFFSCGAVYFKLKQAVSIVESGSNKNGDYLKFADGTMICTKTVVYTGALNFGHGQTYRSNSIDLGDWAIPFAELPFRVIGPKEGTSFWTMNATEIPPSEAAVGAAYVMRGVSSPLTTIALSIIGIGRWN